MRQKYGLEWEATSTDSFGFGSSFVRPRKGFDYQAIPFRLVIPYTDKDNQIQEPEFKMGTPFIQKWAADLFKKVVKSKVALSPQKDSKNKIRITQQQRSSNCLICNRMFDIYDLRLRKGSR